MAKKPKTVEEDEAAGAPDWMVTFSDCMTLLLTFFVLLLSFSSFSPNTLGSISDSFAKSMPSVGLSFSSEQDSFTKNKDSHRFEKLSQGSETRTNAEKKSSNYMREKKPLDFKNLKVFCIPSSRIFFGNGSVLTPEGKEMCEQFSKFLENQDNRIVISENGDSFNQDIGFTRALVIMNELTYQGTISKDRFNVSASSLVKDRKDRQRYLEITLLEKTIH